MDLDKILLINNDWKYSKGRYFKKKVAWIPVVDVLEDRIRIFLDVRGYKEIIKIVKLFGENNIDFRFISHRFADPGFSEDFNETNIKCYLKSFVNESFYFGFKKIDFDFIENIVKYCVENECFDMLKEIYTKVNKKTQDTHWTSFNTQIYYIPNEEIRENFNSLYRDIIIKQILC